MNLTPEERDVGKENFKTAIGGTGAFNRRSFLGGTLAATVAGAGLGAMYFGYDKGDPPSNRSASAFSAPATRGGAARRAIRPTRGNISTWSRSPTFAPTAFIAPFTATRPVPLRFPAAPV